jgi:hypothetical protein
MEVIVYVQVSNECIQAIIETVRQMELDGDGVHLTDSQVCLMLLSGKDKCDSDEPTFAFLQVLELVPRQYRSTEGSSVVAILSPWFAELRRTTCSPPNVLLGASWMPLPPTTDESTIVVIGNTGAGKSTLLNAVLGEMDVLPTNAMRACTAAIIEMEYNYGNPSDDERYEAVIDFANADEWDEEVRQLAATAAEALAAAKKSGFAVPPDTPAADALCTLRSAYGSAADAHLETIDVLLGAPGPIREHLGSTLTVRAADGAALRARYAHAVDSGDDAGVGALWPAVRRVRLRGPWAALCGGVRLVDAPGLADDNGARGGLVRGCLARADGVWLVSNIRRAVNDKTVKDLLSAGLRAELLARGRPGSLAFVATHTDVLVRSEVVENLGLDPAAGLLECALARSAFTKRRVREDFLRGLEPDALPDAPSTAAAAAAAAAAAVSAADPAGEDAPAAGPAQRARWALPVFTVSAVDFQKLAGVRVGDGPPAVFAEEEATEVPALRRLARETAAARRAAAREGAEAYRAGEALVRWLEAARQQAREEELDALGEGGAPAGGDGLGKRAPGGADGAPAAKRGCAGVAAVRAVASQLSLAEARLREIRAAQASGCAARAAGGAAGVGGSVVIDLTLDDD